MERVSFGRECSYSDNAFSRPDPASETHLRPILGGALAQAYRVRYPARMSPQPSMRVVVTGGNGFVAGSVIRQAPADWEVHVLSRSEVKGLGGRVQTHQVLPQDERGLADLFGRVHPQALIHTAAIADIDFCETHPAEAQSVNVEFTRNLARLCVSSEAKLVFCSTDTIFDGEHPPYREDSSPGPLNLYARTKVEAETVVRDSSVRAVIARLALVMGLPLLGAGNSFLPKMLAALKAGRAVEVPAREVRTPVDVVTVGRALIELTANDFSGTMHLAGNDSLNRFTMATRVASHFGFAPELIVPTDPAKIAGRAPRPRDVSLDNSLARKALRTPMLGLDDALRLITQTADLEKP